VVLLAKSVVVVARTNIVEVVTSTLGRVTTELVVGVVVDW
jgi:hypothetical protein